MRLRTLRIIYYIRCVGGRYYSDYQMCLWTSLLYYQMRLRMLMLLYQIHVLAMFRYISLYLATSRYISLHLAKYRYISPTSRYVSLGPATLFYVVRHPALELCKRRLVLLRKTINTFENIIEAFNGFSTFFFESRYISLNQAFPG